MQRTPHRGPGRAGTAPRRRRPRTSHRARATIWTTTTWRGACRMLALSPARGGPNQALRCSSIPKNRLTACPPHSLGTATPETWTVWPLSCACACLTHPRAPGPGWEGNLPARAPTKPPRLIGGLGQSLRETNAEGKKQRAHDAWKPRSTTLLHRLAAKEEAGRARKKKKKRRQPRPPARYCSWQPQAGDNSRTPTPFGCGYAVCPQPVGSGESGATASLGD